MKRTLALFLIALLLISSFTSCGKKKIPEQQTEETETETIIGDGDNSNITDNGGNGGSGDILHIQPLQIRKVTGQSFEYRLGNFFSLHGVFLLSIQKYIDIFLYRL